MSSSLSSSLNVGVWTRGHMIMSGFNTFHRCYSRIHYVPKSFLSSSSILRVHVKLRSPFVPFVHGKPTPKVTNEYPSLRAASILGIGFGLTNYVQKIHSDSTPARTLSSGSDLPPPPTSAVSLYELSFGTVAGICTGIFVKKGAKAVAWFLGGIFVLLQYFRSISIIHVDWGRMATKFESRFFAMDAKGTNKAPTVVSASRWIVDFLTADFQARASFLAGFALGLRIG